MVKLFNQNCMISSMIGVFNKAKGRFSAFVLNNQVLFVIVICMLSIAAPWIFTRSSFVGVSFNETGQIGDTIGGLTAPFFNLLSVVLLYSALRSQIRANELVQSQIQIDFFYREIEQLDKYCSDLAEIIARDNPRQMMALVKPLNRVQVEEAAYQMSVFLNLCSQVEKESAVYKRLALLKERRLYPLLQMVHGKYLKEVPPRLKTDFESTYTNFQTALKSEEM